MTEMQRAEREERVSPLAEQWPYLKFLGLGAWWAWIWLCYNSVEIMRMFPSGDQTFYVYQMYLFSTLGIGCSMFVAAFAWRRATTWVDKRLFVIGAGVFAGIATILLEFSVVMGAGVFFALAAVFTGVGTSILCLKVGRVYGSVSLGDSLTTGAISLILAAFLYFVGVGLPPEWRPFFIASLPVLSALLLTMGAADPFSSAISGAGEDHKKTPLRRKYHKLVAASALIAFTAGVGKGISSMLMDTSAFAREGSITVFCIGVIALLIIFAVDRGDAVRGARQMYSALMVLGLVLMLATCFGFDISYLSVGKESLWLVFTCFMAYMAFRYDLSPVRTFAVGQGMYFLASTAGWAIGAALAPYYDQAIVRMGVALSLVFIVVMVLVYVFPENDLKRIMAWSVDEEVAEPRRPQATGAASSANAVSSDARETTVHTASDSLPASDISAASAASASGEPAGTVELGNIARAADSRYGLSGRELEILDLFAQGRSANWIAENLTISKNTVRAHLRAIYTKLDVHTRQELLDFLAGK